MKSRPATQMTIDHLQEQINRLEQAIKATHKLIKEKQDLIDKFKVELGTQENPRPQPRPWIPGL